MNQCKNGGTCLYDVTSECNNCLCPQAFCGDTCDETNPCKNSASCVYNATSRTTRCFCPSAYCGAKCDKTNICTNGGTCTEDKATNAVLCRCPDGFSGQTCRDVINGTVTIERRMDENPDLIAGLFVGCGLLFVIVVAGVAEAGLSIRRKKRLEALQKIQAARQNNLNHLYEPGSPVRSMSIISSMSWRSKKSLSSSMSSWTGTDLLDSMSSRRSAQCESSMSLLSCVPKPQSSMNVPAILILPSRSSQQMGATRNDEQAGRNGGELFQTSGAQKDPTEPVESFHLKVPKVG